MRRCDPDDGPATAAAAPVRPTADERKLRVTILLTREQRDELDALVKLGEKRGVAVESGACRVDRRHGTGSPHAGGGGAITAELIAIIALGGLLTPILLATIVLGGGDHTRTPPPCRLRLSLEQLLTGLYGRVTPP